MRTILFDDKIEIETIRKLIDDIESKDDNEITIYFTTSGGQSFVGDIIIDYFNTTKREITLIGLWMINSAGFLIFFKSTGLKERRFINAHSVLHLMNRDTNIVESKDKDQYEYFLNKQLENDNKELIEFYRSVGVSEKYINKINKFWDVYLDNNELNELLAKQEQ